LAGGCHDTGSSRGHETSAGTARAPTVAIVGNPNAGKTTVFNALTGSRQKVANYPGVTVERVSGMLRVGNEAFECVDVPGLYSLTPASEDERVAVDVIRGEGGMDERPDLLVCVVDAGNLERNLFLLTQLADEGLPCLVALTKVDQVRSGGQELDLVKLRNLLGTDVVPVVGHKEKGIAELKEAIARNVQEPHTPECDVALAGPLEARVATLRERLARVGADYSKAQVRRELLHPSERFQAYLNDFPEVAEVFEAARGEIGEGQTPTGDVANRYSWCAMVQQAVLVGSKTRRGPTDRIDYWLTHRVFGLGVFLAIMLIVFESIYTFAQPLMNGIQWCFDTTGALLSPHLAGIPWLQSMIVTGIIGGVGRMLVFLPQIVILFFFIAALEGSGYLARAAFLMDRLLGWCGLNGRAFIPLLSSFACAIPGIMAARVMPDQRSRLATILVAPLMSCSARLPVYLLLIGAFIQPKYGDIWAGAALFGMHLVGLAVSIPVVWVLNRRVLRGKRLPFRSGGTCGWRCISAARCS